MKAFVTGAAGFIGSRLVKHLCENGVEVTALVRETARDFPAGVKVVRGDIARPDTLADLGRGCDRLYHLAGMVSFDPARRADLVRVNGEGTVNVLRAASRWGVERCVAVSSGSTIGLSQAPTEILDENTPPSEALAARNPYLASKLAAERAAREACGDLHVVIVNPTTVYGPGDRSLNSGALVLQVARAPALPVPPGGGNVVDVDDVAEGIVRAGEKGDARRRYILGGENLHFRRIFSEVAEVVGSRPLLVPLPGWMRRPVEAAAWAAGRLAGSRLVTPQVIGDMFAYKFFSSERATRELGYAPKRTFRQSVARAWAFYREEGLV